MKKVILISLLFAPHLALAEETAAHWSYMGETGPEHWAEIAPEDKACKAGTRQSPIDLSKTDAVGELSFTSDYRAVPMKIWNNGHTIQLDAKNAGEMAEDGKIYNLLQVHFHDPSEHALNGKNYPLEAHFVHRDKDGELAVLGVFIEEGAENPELAKIISHIPAKPGEPMVVEGLDFDPSALLPDNLAAYRYSGSLTTPPCTEGVAWRILSHPITASADQIKALADVMGSNNRPLQAVNGRLVVHPAQ
ncbi:carbonic anhydrase [Paracoccus onubensis]|uniref:carbonic anhydrase n=1 Tax=Paracoccus onubensis TaxID=1675788 RepID=UPI00272FCA5F|nr:carbonic anhydrase [Paracoccus onubensis]MDP0930297.1 carbonic anhydrase [Paracoccus onubensis]